MVRDNFLTLPGLLTRNDIKVIIFSIYVSKTLCYMWCALCAFCCFFLFLSALSAMSLSIVYFGYDLILNKINKCKLEIAEAAPSSTDRDSFPQTIFVFIGSHVLR